MLLVEVDTVLVMSRWSMWVPRMDHKTQPASKELHAATSVRPDVLMICPHFLYSLGRKHTVDDRHVDTTFLERFAVLQHHGPASTTRFSPFPFVGTEPG
ncbi:hypothetical protein OGATHE_002937 [Ogataea polymorpha]|uniref:Uncharacterized protein n=1 Tax=Ogataea polymorpha TaxID=460523 RepID=A0A9P8PF71_9ASCO|nr:hypothetical protein OGATHE_002937 [Ogataea polymorpha]